MSALFAGSGNKRKKSINDTDVIDLPPSGELFDGDIRRSPPKSNPASDISLMSLFDSLESLNKLYGLSPSNNTNTNTPGTSNNTSNSANRRHSTVNNTTVIHKMSTPASAPTTPRTPSTIASSSSPSTPRTPSTTSSSPSPSLSTPSPSAPRTTAITTTITGSPSALSTSVGSFVEVGSPLSIQKQDVQCPICGTWLKGCTDSVANAHIDDCLTKSMLDTESKTHAKRRSSSSSKKAQKKAEGLMTVKCPYSPCSLSMNAYDFIGHALTKHNKANQALSCPICAITTGMVYRVTEKTNLNQHLKDVHSHDRPNQEKSLFFDIDDDDEFGLRGEDDGDDGADDSDASDDDGAYAVHTGPYIVEVLKRDMDGKECTICFEEFLQGHTVSRLMCLCVFHKKCIDSWFDKSKATKCPLHTG